MTQALNQQNIPAARIVRRITEWMAQTNLRCENPTKSQVATWIDGLKGAAEVLAANPPKPVVDRISIESATEHAAEAAYAVAELSSQAMKFSTAEEHKLMNAQTQRILVALNALALGVCRINYEQNTHIAQIGE